MAKNRVKLLTFLIREGGGVDVNIKNSRNVSALQIACLHLCFEAIQILTAQDDIICDEDCLVYAIQNSNTSRSNNEVIADICEILFKKKRSFSDKLKFFL